MKQPLPLKIIPLTPQHPADLDFLNSINIYLGNKNAPIFSPIFNMNNGNIIYNIIKEKSFHGGWRFTSLLCAYIEVLNTRIREL